MDDSQQPMDNMTPPADMGAKKCNNPDCTCTMDSPAGQTCGACGHDHGAQTTPPAAPAA